MNSNKYDIDVLVQNIIDAGPQPTTVTAAHSRDLSKRALLLRDKTPVAAVGGAARATGKSAGANEQPEQKTNKYNCAKWNIINNKYTVIPRAAWLNIQVKTYIRFIFVDAHGVERISSGGRVTHNEEGNNGVRKITFAHRLRPITFTTDKVTKIVKLKPMAARGVKQPTALAGISAENMAIITAGDASLQPTVTKQMNHMTDQQTVLNRMRQMELKQTQLMNVLRDMNHQNVGRQRPAQ